jgi:N-dimethylarginine dimethylaminohydrolase
MIVFMTKPRDNFGDLLEDAADDANEEIQPDWEAIAEVKELAGEYAKKGATVDELEELRQLADDAVPKSRPELLEELTRTIDAATEAAHALKA